MKKIIRKSISLMLSLIMLFSAFTAISFVYAAAGDSEANPAIVSTYSDLKAAMESSSIKYVKMISNGQRNQITSTTLTDSAIVVKTPKVLTLEGNNIIAAPTSGDVSALFRVSADITVQGTGKLTYYSYAKSKDSGIFVIDNDSLLTLDLTGTLECIADETDKYAKRFGKIIDANIGRIYIKRGNYIGTVDGSAYVSDEEQGAIDVSGKAKMIISGGTFDTYYSDLPQYDIFFPAVLIESDHTSPGYVSIEGGTFNGILSKAKTLNNYIKSPLVVVDENTKTVADINNKKTTPEGSIKDGKFDIRNYNVVSVYTCSKPEFQIMYPNLSGPNGNLIDEYLDTKYDVVVKAEPVHEHLAKVGFNIQTKLEIYDPLNRLVYSNVDSIGNGLRYTHTYNIVGTYRIDMIASLRYYESSVSTTTQSFVVTVTKKPCAHEYEIISDSTSCEAKGEIKKQCIYCADLEYEYYDALGHKFIDGYLTDNEQHHKVCERCNQIIESYDHSFVGDTCTVCGYVDGCEAEYMSHEYDNEYHWFSCMTHGEGECPNNGQLEKAPHIPTGDYNCQQGYECEECGWYYGETGHHLWVIDELRCVEPTETTEGKIVYTCGYYGTKNNRGETIVCKELLEITVPSLSHTWDYDNPVSDTATCEHDGFVTYKCTDDGCEELYEAYSPQKDHDNEWVVIAEATDESTGTKALTCKHCGFVSEYADIPVGGDYILGDVDGDGDVDADDYILLKRVFFGIAKLEKQKNPETAFARSDVDKNGLIEADDYILLKRVFFGIAKLS